MDKIIFGFFLLLDLKRKYPKRFQEKICEKSPKYFKELFAAVE